MSLQSVKTFENSSYDLPTALESVELAASIFLARCEAERKPVTVTVMDMQAVPLQEVYNKWSVILTLVLQEGR